MAHYLCTFKVGTHEFKDHLQKLYHTKWPVLHSWYLKYGTTYKKNSGCETGDYHDSSALDRKSEFEPEKKKMSF